MVEAQMTTSDIGKLLNGSMAWKDFCNLYHTELQIFCKRNDGIYTSGDFKMKFDKDVTLIKKSSIKNLCSAFESKEINNDELEFIATAILLCGFDFDYDNTEDAVHILSNLEDESADIVEVRALLDTSQ